MSGDVPTPGNRFQRIDAGTAHRVAEIHQHEMFDSVGVHSCELEQVGRCVSVEVEEDESLTLLEVLIGQ